MDHSKSYREGVDSLMVVQEKLRRKWYDDGGQWRWHTNGLTFFAGFHIHLQERPLVADQSKLIYLLGTWG